MQVKFLIIAFNCSQCDNVSDNNTEIKNVENGFILLRPPASELSKIYAWGNSKEL